MWKTTLLIAVAFFSPLTVFGETSLFLSPIVGTYDTNTVFQVNVLVSSGEEKVNAVDAKLSFDPKEIEVDRIETVDSILTSWTLEPRYDNQIGEIVFAGLMSASSSFSGERGRVLTLFLKGLRSTESRLRFDASSAAVLASDGTGGNVLAETKAGIYMFSPKESVPPETPGSASLPGEVLGATTLALTSSTHPDATAWYAKRNAAFSWMVDATVSSVSLAFTDSENEPSTMRRYGQISSREIADIEDGIWYFHVVKEAGDGSVVRESIRVGVDATPPNALSLVELDRDSDDPNVSFEVAAGDILSGIDRIELSLDGGVPIVVSTGSTSTKQFIVPLPGTYTLNAVAFDKAGNTISRDISFAVDALPTPQISLDETELKEGGMISFSGSAQRRTELWIERVRLGGGEKVLEHITVPDDGAVEFLSTTKLLPGEYDMVFRVKDARGGMSLDTQAVRIVVSPTMLGVIKRHPVIPFSVLGLLFLLGFMGFYVKRIRSRSIVSGDHGDGVHSLVSPESTFTQVSSPVPVSLTSARVALPQTQVIDLRANH